MNKLTIVRGWFFDHMTQGCIKPLYSEFFVSFKNEVLILFKGMGMEGPALTLAFAYNAIYHAIVVI